MAEKMKNLGEFIFFDEFGGNSLSQQGFNLQNEGYPIQLIWYSKEKKQYEFNFKAAEVFFYKYFFFNLNNYFQKIFVLAFIKFLRWNILYKYSWSS